jgi:hypothetical protein
VSKLDAFLVSYSHEPSLCKLIALRHDMVQLMSSNKLEDVVWSANYVIQTACSNHLCVSSLPVWSAKKELQIYGGFHFAAIIFLF